MGREELRREKELLAWMTISLWHLSLALKENRLKPHVMECYQWEHKYCTVIKPPKYSGD